MDEHTHFDEELEKRWSKWDIHNGYTDKAGHPIIHHGEDVEEILKNHPKLQMFWAKKGLFLNLCNFFVSDSYFRSKRESMFLSCFEKVFST